MDHSCTLESFATHTSQWVTNLSYWYTAHKRCQKISKSECQYTIALFIKGQRPEVLVLNNDPIIWIWSKSTLRIAIYPGQSGVTVVSACREYSEDWPSQVWCSFSWIWHLFIGPVALPWYSLSCSLCLKHQFPIPTPAKYSNQCSVL